MCDPASNGRAVSGWLQRRRRRRQIPASVPPAGPPATCQPRPPVPTSSCPQGAESRLLTALGWLNPLVPVPNLPRPLWLGGLAAAASIIASLYVPHDNWAP